MSDPVRWGLLATGGIAHTFAQDLIGHAPDATITAVGASVSGGPAFSSLIAATRCGGRLPVGDTSPRLIARCGICPGATWNHCGKK